MSETTEMNNNDNKVKLEWKHAWKHAQLIISGDILAVSMLPTPIPTPIYRSEIAELLNNPFYQSTAKLRSFVHCSSHQKDLTIEINTITYEIKSNKYSHRIVYPRYPNKEMDEFKPQDIMALWYVKKFSEEKVIPLKWGDPKYHIISGLVTKDINIINMILAIAMVMGESPFFVDGVGWVRIVKLS